MEKHIRDRWLLNLGLLAGVLILATILITDKEKTQAHQPILSSRLPATIDRITLHNAGRQFIQFEKQDNVWRMLQPYKVSADPVQIKNLLSLREQTINGELDTIELDLADFGLQQPATTIEFNDVSVAFGDAQPVNRQRYIRIGGQILLINDGLQEQLNASSISFISRRPIPEGKQIERIIIDEKPVDEALATRLAEQWRNTSANWISQLDGEASGITIEIKLKQQAESIKLYAQQREYDLVLIQPEHKIEYHLASNMGELLGISKPSPNISSDASTNTRVEAVPSPAQSSQ